MTESMIERVAKALCAENAPLDINWENFIPEARAAIEAMREPTAEMFTFSSFKSVDDLYRYQAMIDAALTWPAGSADRAVVPMARD